MKNMKSKQQGYSLVELSISLAIIAILLAGGLTGVQQILRANKVNNLIKSTNSAVAAITTQTMRQANFAGATLQALSGLGVWPTTAVVNGGAAGATVTHEFNGAVGVQPNANGLGTYAANQTLRYTLLNVPAEACADVVQGLEPVAERIYVTGPAPAAVPVDGTEPAVALRVKDINTRINLATLGTNCGQNRNTMIDFYIAKN